MATIQQVAEAFAKGLTAKSHNSSTNGTAYYLHGHRIAEKVDAHHVRFDWCGWYTPTTANHMNYLLRAIGSQIKVSWSQRHESGDFVVEV